MGKWMIYGANGYTGRITAELAAERGLTPVLAGVDTGGPWARLPSSATRGFEEIGPYWAERCSVATKW